MTCTANCKPFDPVLNRAIIYLASRVCPQGWDASPDAPGTLEEVDQYTSKYGKICVWDGDYGDSFLCDREADLAFAAWHDWHHHVGCLTFDRAGETEAWRRHVVDLERLTGESAQVSPRMAAWAGILYARLVGQFDYRDVWGCDPDFTKGFSQHYYRDPLGAISDPKYRT